MLDLLLMLLIGIVYLNPYITKKNKSELLLHTIFYFYICFVLYQTLLPIIPTLLHLNPYRFGRTNFSPFIDLLEGHSNAQMEILLNIILMIPLGFFLKTLYHLKWYKALVIAVIFSFTIEVVQPIIHTIRAFDITDIITNSFGAFIGICITTFITKQNK